MLAVNSLNRRSLNSSWWGNHEKDEGGWLHLLKMYVRSKWSDIILNWILMKNEISHCRIMASNACIVGSVDFFLLLMNRQKILYCLCELDIGNYLWIIFRWKDSSVPSKVIDRIRRKKDVTWRNWISKWSDWLQL